MKEQKKKEEPIEWDKKKIFIFLISLILVVIAVYQLKIILLGQDTNLKDFSVSKSKTAVRGVATEQLQSKGLNIKQGIRNEIESLKNEAQNINLVDIASSSPQVQKVINDLKAIQNYPSNQFKEACEKVCSGL